MLHKNGENVLEEGIIGDHLCHLSCLGRVPLEGLGVRNYKIIKNIIIIIKDSSKNVFDLA
jgi:hypothetical protein